MLDNIGKKLIGSEDERAVSPVIGVILMVAITVILAAVIAAFVLDLGDSIDTEASAGINIDGDGTDSVTVTLNSVSGDTAGVYIEGDAAGPSESAADLGEVGESVTIGSGETIDGDGDYSVVAYIGSEADNAETTTVVSTFEVEP